MTTTTTETDLDAALGHIGSILAMERDISELLAQRPPHYVKVELLIELSDLRAELAYLFGEYGIDPRIAGPARGTA